MSGLIWCQTVCKGYKQTTTVYISGLGVKKDNFIIFCSHNWQYKGSNECHMLTLLVFVGFHSILIILRCISQMGLDTTKPVFGVSDKARLKPVSTASGTS